MWNYTCNVCEVLMFYSILEERRSSQCPIIIEMSCVSTTVGLQGKMAKNDSVNRGTSSLNSSLEWWSLIIDNLSPNGAVCIDILYVRCRHLPNCILLLFSHQCSRFSHNFQQFQWNRVHLLYFQALNKTALFLFSVHNFHKVQFKAAEEGRSEVGLDIIGAHSWVHQLSTSSFHQRIKVWRLLFFFSGIWWPSGLSWAEHCDCSAFITEQNTFQFKFSAWAGKLN